MPLSRIVELALLIVSKTTDVDLKLNAANLPTPSFGPDGLNDSLLRDEIAESRQSIIEATEELHALMLGPVGLLTSQSHEIFISLQAIYQFRLANAFPNGKEEASFDEIAQISGFPRSKIQRILRHAISYRIFCEPRIGIVAHTAASKYLATTPLMYEWIGMVTEEMWPAASKTVEALIRWSNSDEPNQSGFNIAHNTDETVFDELAMFPDRAARYAGAMTWFSTGPGLEATHVVNGFPWETLQTGTVVDIGGSHGSISIAIAQQFPSLRFVVQDQRDVIEAGRAQLPSGLQTRVTFTEHDFFMEQPVKAADVYLLRWILHDWPDTYAIKILKALIPALRDGSRLCICEHVLPEPGNISTYQARGLRSMDLAMLEFHNAQERDRTGWAKLISSADARFRIIDIKQPLGSRLSLIEISWQSCL
ncbi:MAG: hypothetical protein Q9166_004766 [cf. Caloplaca sp. 2 TL-2023]